MKTKSIYSTSTSKPTHLITNPHAHIFYQPPASILNSFQKYHKAAADITHQSPQTPIKSKPKNETTHKKNSKSMEISTPIYIVNNKKNYIIYNDIKFTNSSMNDYSITEKTVTSPNKKTLNDHYEEIFHKIKINDIYRKQPIQTPCFKATALNFNKPNGNQEKINEFNDKLNKFNEKQKEINEFNEKTKKMCSTTGKIQINDNKNHKNLKEINEFTTNNDDYERKEKLKLSKSIGNSEICYSTEETIKIDYKTDKKEKNYNAKNIGDSSQTKEKKEKKRWDENEDKLLIESFSNFSTLQKKIGKWDYIASQINCRNPSQCKQRYKRLVKPPNIRKKWTGIEDKILKNAVEIEKLASWEIIADRMKAKGFERTGKQVRERYKNHLDPTINSSQFKLEEDMIILSYYKEYGNKWAKIAKHLVNRSENSVKNRFHYHFKKNFGLEVKPNNGNNGNLSEETTNKIETEMSFSDDDLPDLKEMDDAKYYEIFGVAPDFVLKFSKGLSGESEKAYKELKNVDNSFEF